MWPDTPIYGLLDEDDTDALRNERIRAGRPPIAPQAPRIPKDSRKSLANAVWRYRAHVVPEIAATGDWAKLATAYYLLDQKIAALEAFGRKRKRRRGG